MARRAVRLALGLPAVVAVAIAAAASPALSLGDCTDSRCAQARRVPPPKIHHSQRKQICCCEPPPGWGWYRRQKFYNQCSQPLVVFDQLGDAVSVHPNW